MRPEVPAWRCGVVVVDALASDPAGLGVVSEAPRVHESIAQDPVARKEQGQALHLGPWK